MSKKIIENSKNDTASWSVVQYDLKDDFKSIIWNSWVKPLVFVEYTNFILIIKTPSELVKNRIDNQYYDQIFFRAKRVFIGLNKIRFTVLKDKKLIHKTSKIPGLAVVLVGENPASKVFVRNNIEQTKPKYLSAKWFFSETNPIYI